MTAIFVACVFTFLLVPAYLLCAGRRRSRSNLSDLERRTDVRAAAHEGIARHRTRPYGNVEQTYDKDAA